ncbi:transposable element, partial [Pseudoloma neurophilia]
MRTANNTPVKSIGKKKLSIRLKPRHKPIHTVTFEVFPELNHQMILGCNFLEETETTFNFQNKMTTLGNTAINMSTDKQKYATAAISCDKKVDTKAKCPIKITEIANAQPEIGHISNVTHQINMLDNEPIIQPPYRIPYDLIEDTKRELQLLEKQGIILKSNGGWATLAFSKRKKNGGIRLLNDFRLLNQKTEDDPFPSPNITDT